MLIHSQDFIYLTAVALLGDRISKLQNSNQDYFMLESSLLLHFTKLEAKAVPTFKS